MGKCPYCGKELKYVNAHIRRMHPDKETIKKGRKRSLDSLEESIEDKFFGDDGDKEEKDKDEKKKEKKKDSGEPLFEKIVEVDYYLTDLHTSEVGFFVKERFMAKNRSFGRNLEIVGKVSQEGKNDGMFAYDSDNWDKIPKDDFGKKRLVVKWFNRKSVSHLGTIEEMVISSISSSIGANDTLPYFKCIIPRYDYIVNVKKEHTRFKVGEIFTFAIKVDDDNWQVFAMDEKRLSIGSDWTIRSGKDVVAKINEKILNIGGKFIIHFLNEELYKCLPFFRTIVLFTMMLKFKEEIFKDIQRMKKLSEKGMLKIDLAAEEERFMRNPRALKR